MPSPTGRKAGFLSLRLALVLIFREGRYTQGKGLSMVDIADLARSGYLTSIASEARSLIQRYDIREVIRQSQSFQPYWIDWSYIPSHEKIKFLIRLNKVSNNITPALSITEIVLLWFQDFEDKKKRIKKAEKLIKLILNGFLTASFYSRELHLEPFDKQVKTIIAIDDFERCALDGFISKSAPEFASYWRAKLKTQLVLPVQAEKKTYENSKARTLLLACLDNYNGTPPNYKTLLTRALSNVPQGYEGLKLIDHEEFAMKKLTWNGGSIYLKQFSKAFTNEKNQFRPI